MSTRPESGVTATHSVQAGVAVVQAGAAGAGLEKAPIEKTIRAHSSFRIVLS